MMEPTDAFCLQISTDPVDVKAWKHRITKKLRFSLSGSRLDKILCDLRSLNDDFRTLSDQRLKSTSTQKRRLAGNLYNHSHQEVEKYKAVGHASRQVYEALGKACTKHTEHEAHFCVEVEQVIIDESHGTQLRFNMAFTHLTLAGSINKGPLIWFVVDSKSSDAMALEHPVVTAEYNGLLAHSLKRQIEPIEPTPGAPQKKVKKSVRFETSALAPTCTSTSATATMDDALLACKSMREDFCDSIRKRIRHPSKESQCVSIIGDIDSYRHHVFLSSTTSCYQRRQAISLGHLISRMSNGQNMNRISLYDRLRLAKTLAIAVLQYHATPWLTVSWRSGDVYFFGDDMNPIQERISLTPPHLSVKIKRPNGKMSRGSTLPNNTFIRNPLLFSLGVVLLEIAHTSTLGNLQRPSDLENGQESKYTEFFVARRLAKFGSTDMGRRYHRIVERLVECDFGCGTDLNSPQLQAAFHEDIICPLEKLEQKLHDFHFDPDLAPKESPLSDQEASRT